MAEDSLRYDRMVESAMRGVVRQALIQAAERGLPGEHHFYITFRTDHPDVEVSDALRRRYPGEMTIVLQHKFWGLKVGEPGFEVTLSFSEVPERLVIPFSAVTAFADPSVRFGLQFEGTDGATKAAAEAAADETPPAAAPVRPADAGAPETVSKVVALDTFRKK